MALWLHRCGPRTASVVRFRSTTAANLPCTRRRIGSTRLAGFLAFLVPLPAVPTLLCAKYLFVAAIGRRPPRRAAARRGGSFKLGCPLGGLAMEPRPHLALIGPLAASRRGQHAPERTSRSVSVNNADRPRPLLRGRAGVAASSPGAAHRAAPVFLLARGRPVYLLVGRTSMPGATPGWPSPVTKPARGGRLRAGQSDPKRNPRSGVDAPPGRACRFALRQAQRLVRENWRLIERLALALDKTGGEDDRRRDRRAARVDE